MRTDFSSKDPPLRDDRAVSRWLTARSGPAQQPGTPVLLSDSHSTEGHDGLSADEANLVHQEAAVAESRFGLTELADLPDDLRARIGAVAAKSGFVPNIFRALGHRPAELRAFLDYHDALMDRTEGLTKAERELVVVATSGANHCTYCIVAHGAILRIRSKDPQLADQVAANPWQAELEPRARAIVDLAL